MAAMAFTDETLAAYYFSSVAVSLPNVGEIKPVIKILDGMVANHHTRAETIFFNDPLSLAASLASYPAQYFLPGVADRHPLLNPARDIQTFPVPH